MHSLKLPLTRAGLGRASDYLIPAIGLMAVASAAYAGADTTFGPALTKFTDFLEGSGGKIIAVQDEIALADVDGAMHLVAW
jgi:hypothetical protein